MAKMDIENKLFKLPIDIDAAGAVTKVLATADTYVDKNIEIDINVPDAEFGVTKTGEITATVSTTDTTYTSDTATPYAIEIAANANAKGITVGVTAPGFAAASDTVDIAAMDADADTKTLYLKEGTLTGSGAAAAEGNVTLTKVGTAPADGFYVKASASGEVGVGTAGWVDPEKTAKVETNGEAYYTLKGATLSNNETGDFAEVAAPVLTEDGYLFINEGYIGNTKISLATLVPDDANITTENANLVYNTVKAYDVDGKLIVGTMGDAELGAITADDASANIGAVTVAANEDNSAFVVSGTGTISGNASVAISKRGLAETSLSQNGVIEGSATVEAPLAKIGLGVDVEGEDGAIVTPVVVTEDASTVVAGSATTTKPNGFYVAVSVPAQEAEVTVTPTVLAAGYGTADLHSATGDTIDVGMNASGVYYVGVQAGSHSISTEEPAVVNATVTVTPEAEATDGFEGNLVAGVLSAAPASGEYITISNSCDTNAGSVTGGVTCTATEGYVVAGQETETVSGTVDVEATATAKKYIRVYDGTIL